MFKYKPNRWAIVLNNKIMLFSKERDLFIDMGCSAYPACYVSKEEWYVWPPDDITLD